MIRRLLEANYAQHAAAPNVAQARFWLRELRTPELLLTCAAAFPDGASSVANDRPAVAAAVAGDASDIQAALAAEESHERELDREYWTPLRAELEEMRRQGRRGR